MLNVEVEMFNIEVLRSDAIHSIYRILVLLNIECRILNIEVEMFNVQV